MPEIVHECGPAQREVLRIELHGARRQITADDWKPLVDHLRAQRTDSGVRRFSDRVIARAVGIDRMLVQRYKSPDHAFGSREPYAQSTMREDGKVRHSNPEWTAKSRVLHLIAQSAAGLTAVELLNDEVLREFGEGTVRRLPGQLRDEGLVEADGKRNGSTVWRPAAAKTPEPPASTVTRKADRLLDLAADTEVREAAKARLNGRKGDRQALAVLHAAERELDAALRDRDRREVDEEKERLRLAEIARDQAHKSIKAWENLTVEVHAAWVAIASYVNILDDLPALRPSTQRILDRELDELRQQMDWLDKRLHPGGNRNPLREGAIIDV